MKHAIEQALKKSLGDIIPDFNEHDFFLERPRDYGNGDWVTNIAMQKGESMGKKPLHLAKEIQEKTMWPKGVAHTTAVAPGFLNVYLDDASFTDSVSRKARGEFPIPQYLKGSTIMVEYTDPNPFKVFHIGHLMPNVIGESLATLLESAGAKVLRASYQGDVGIHVARAVWAMRKHKDIMPKESASLSKKVEFLGDMYTEGGKQYKEDETAKSEIDALNKVIYELDDTLDEEVRTLYETGRTWSLLHFEELYQKLGTAFDYYFFESEVAEEGKAIVEEHINDRIFEESEGAIVFHGEKYGLHTRVFITQNSIPTYEAKEIGLNQLKFRFEQTLDTSYVITGNEQADYMKIVLKAIEQFQPEIAQKTIHLTHGLMLGVDGKKIASRKGGVITGEGLLNEMEEEARRKMDEADFVPKDAREQLATDIAVAGIKYMILRQAISKNIVFDHEQALSFEGNSGPYLQYTYARCHSILKKAGNITIEKNQPEGWTLLMIERMLERFEEIVHQSTRDSAPHHLVQYLTELSRVFNSWYAEEQILVEGDTKTPYRLTVTQATRETLKKGLHLLGIRSPEMM